MRNKYKWEVKEAVCFYVHGVQNTMLHCSLLVHFGSTIPQPALKKLFLASLARYVTTWRDKSMVKKTGHNLLCALQRNMKICFHSELGSTKRISK